MQSLTLFSFFANNSRMKGPLPVLLTYLDLPNGLEGGSTANYFFWIFMLNKVCTAKREAILSFMQRKISLNSTFLGQVGHQFVISCFRYFLVIHGVTSPLFVSDGTMVTVW